MVRGSTNHDPYLGIRSARAYAVLAPAYDLLTAEYAYGPWLAAIERLARRHGLRGRRVLDAAAAPARASCPCSSAASRSPRATSRRRWWRSRRQGGRPRRRAGRGHAPSPVFGEFDLITCIDDAINHLLSPKRSPTRSRACARTSRPAGCSCSTSTRSPPTAGARSWSRTRTGCCAGAATRRDVEPGGEAEVVIDVFAHVGDGLWRRSVSRQRHRHHPIEEHLRARRATRGSRSRPCSVSVPAPCSTRSSTRSSTARPSSSRDAKGGRNDLAPLG